MKRMLMLTVVVALILIGTTNAAVEKGDTEVSIYGSWQKLNDEGGDSLDITTIAGGLGYFVTDELQLSLVGNWSEMSVDGLDLTLWGLGGNAKYHFMTDSTTVPYVGGQFLYEKLEASTSGGWSGGGSVDGYLYGPLLGAKFFMNDSTSLFVEYQYQMYGGDLDDGLDDGHAVMFGIAYLF